MKFELKNWGCEDTEGFEEAAEILKLERGEDGVPLTLEHGELPGCSYDGKRAVITCPSRVLIWRELGILKERMEEGDKFTCQEKPAYQELGVLLDCSRNGVLKVDAVKDIIRYLALMGYSSMQLYTEDTYRIEDEPYFGYQRGAYTRDEFKEMDAYASVFGIELVPCIQTLAHLEGMLRWKEYEKVKDIDNILLTDAEKTYELIEKMFRQMSQNLKSRRINIGMDEAHLLGLGKHLDLHGYENRMDLMLRHYRNVIAIAEKYGYQSMMWSDMFFRLATQGEYYADEEIAVDASVKETISDDVTLIYWDYYTLEPEKYDKMFQSHKRITDRIAFAGGAWKWEGPCPNAWYSREIAPVAHQSCKRNGIDQVLITAWGDNGDECPLYAVLPAFSQWAELCYTDCSKDEYMEIRFHTCTGASYQAFLHLGDGAVLPDNPIPGRCGVNPLRYLLYQDLLGGLFDAHVCAGQKEYLEKYAAVMEEAMREAPEKWRYLFETQMVLDRFLSHKCMLGIEIRSGYLENDCDKLRSCGKKIIELCKELDEVLRTVNRQWCRENKIFGLDVLQLRLGGLRQRIAFAGERLKDYCTGSVDQLEELNEAPLPYYGSKEGIQSAVSPAWNRIVSACNI